jgi:hypothetical protein
MRYNNHGGMKVSEFVKHFKNEHIYVKMGKDNQIGLSPISIKLFMDMYNIKRDKLLNHEHNYIISSLERIYAKENNIQRSIKITDNFNIKGTHLSYDFYIKEIQCILGDVACTEEEVKELVDNIFEDFKETISEDHSPRLTTNTKFVVSNEEISKDKPLEKFFTRKYLHNYLSNSLLKELTYDGFNFNLTKLYYALKENKDNIHELLGFNEYTVLSKDTVILRDNLCGSNIDYDVQSNSIRLQDEGKTVHVKSSKFLKKQEEMERKFSHLKDNFSSYIDKVEEEKATKEEKEFVEWSHHSRNSPNNYEKIYKFGFRFLSPISVLSYNMNSRYKLVDNRDRSFNFKDLDTYDISIESHSNNLINEKLKGISLKSILDNISSINILNKIEENDLIKKKVDMSSWCDVDGNPLFSKKKEIESKEMNISNITEENTTKYTVQRKTVSFNFDKYDENKIKRLEDSVQMYFESLKV